MLTLFHDYTDPASAVAVARLQRLADEGIAVSFVAFEVNPADVPRPVDLATLDAIDRLASQAASEGVALHRPDQLAPTARAHLVSELAEERGLGASWRQTCYRALWTDGADIADAGTLTDLANLAGLDPEAVAARLDDRAALARLRRASAQRRRDGVGGVPTILCQRTLVPGLLDEDDLRALAALG